MGELYVTKDPSLVLAAYGLGSCVGVSAYDGLARAGALAHVMLPRSTEATCQDKGFKFADTAIPAMMERLAKLGAAQSRLAFHIVGGAHVLQALLPLDNFKIGERNVQAVLEALRRYQVTPAATDTGGCRGRTLRLVVETGKVFVRVTGQEDLELKASGP